MFLKAIKEDIETGNTRIIILNKKDAEKLDLYPSDRVEISNKNHKAISIVDIAYNNKTVKPGTAILYKELTNELKIRKNSIIKIKHALKPKSIDLIKKKLSGNRLNKEEFKIIIKDIVANKLTDIELTYFVAACSTHNLTLKEVKHLVNAIVTTGIKLDFGTKKIVDKHCIGGVPGNRTTMIVTPIVAAAGLVMPKTSSRAITSPAGTADTMECLASVTHTEKEIKQIVKKTNACMIWGGAINLAPADDKIIRVEHPLSIDVSGLLLSSILSKKLSVSATHLLIDIPFGKGAKIESLKKAKQLKNKFKQMTKALGIKSKIILTDGSKPIGRGIGPYLESIDVMKVLNNEEDAPQDLKEKSIMLASEILNLAGIKNSKKKARHILESGLALKKMKEIIQAQGPAKKIKPARFKKEIKINKTGTIKHIDNVFISKLAKILGAPKSKVSGVYLNRTVNEATDKNTTILTLYSNSLDKLKAGEEFCKQEINKKIIITN